MKALVVESPGRLGLTERPMPRVQGSRDAVIRIIASSLCEADLQSFRRGESPLPVGRVIGHEGVGIVDEVGSLVTRFRPGDRVLASSVTSCGECDPCRWGKYSACENGGRQIGIEIDGCQAEFVRIPYADRALHLVPPELSDDAALMLCELTPTAYEAGIITGNLQHGDSLAILGAGAVAQATVLVTRLCSPAYFVLAGRSSTGLSTARSLGASLTLDSRKRDVASQLLKLSGEAGYKVVIDTECSPESVALTHRIVAEHGTVAAVQLHAEGIACSVLGDRDRKRTVDYRCGVTNGGTIAALIQAAQTKRIEPELLVTHRYSFDRLDEAFRSVLADSPSKPIKVSISPRSTGYQGFGATLKAFPARSTGDEHRFYKGQIRSFQPMAAELLRG